TLGLMLVYSWKLALVTLLAVALYLGIRWLAYRPVRDGTERQLVAAAKQQTHRLESLRGMQSLKVAGEEATRRSTYDNLMVDTVNQEVRLARMGLGFNSASQLAALPGSPCRPSGCHMSSGGWLPPPRPSG